MQLCLHSCQSVAKVIWNSSQASYGSIHEMNLYPADGIRRGHCSQEVYYSWAFRAGVSLVLHRNRYGTSKDGAKFMQGRREHHEWRKQCVWFFHLLQLPPLFFFQIRKRLILSDKGQLDWKKMYFKLIRCYPRKEQYGDTLQLCRHCHILSWKVWSVGGLGWLPWLGQGHSELPLIAAA